jgi:hypothetical protein
MNTTIRKITAAIVLASTAVLLWLHNAGAAATYDPNNPCVVAITHTWPANTHARILAVSFRESRHQQAVMNARAVGRWGHATGCLQILPGVARNVGGNCNLREAWCNASVGLKLFRKMGWSPWAVRGRR